MEGSCMPVLYIGRKVLKGKNFITEENADTLINFSCICHQSSKH